MSTLSLFFQKMCKWHTDGFNVIVDLDSTCGASNLSIRIKFWAAKDHPKEFLMQQYTANVLREMYGGLAYLRREYANNTRAWTGPSRAVTHVNRKSVVHAEQLPVDRVETRAAKTKRLETLDAGSQIYTIFKIGSYLIVTLTVEHTRKCRSWRTFLEHGPSSSHTKSILSARVQIYKIADESVSLVIDKDFTELPFASEDDASEDDNSDDFEHEDADAADRIDLHDDDNHVYHVNLKRTGPANDTKTHVKDTKTHVCISCELDAKSKQNIVDCITQYLDHE
jgi:hypothetical protein